MHTVCRIVTLADRREAPARRAHMPTLVIAGAPLGRIGTLEVRLARNEPKSPRRRKCVTASSTTNLAPGKTGSRRSTGATPTVSMRSATICWCSTLRLPAPSTAASSAPTGCCGQEVAAPAGGFYSEDEFELTKLIARHPGQRFLELGRSCVLPRIPLQAHHRGAVARHLGLYQRTTSIGVMTGCASFHGTVPAAHAEALSYLAHNCRASRTGTCAPCRAAIARWT